MNDENSAIPKMSEEEINERIRTTLNAIIPFNKTIGIRITNVDSPATIEFDRQEHLIGNSISDFLHGGVTASALDFVGGQAILAAIIKRDPYRQDLPKLLAKVGTIDLRIDYLRGARGKYFVCTAEIMRIGKRVAVVRMEMVNDEGVLLACGTASYKVG